MGATVAMHAAYGDTEMCPHIVCIARRNVGKHSGRSSLAEDVVLLSSANVLCQAALRRWM
jgi:hypothetical protein